MSFYRNDPRYKLWNDYILTDRDFVQGKITYVEPEEYEHDENNFYPNRCFYYCNLERENNDGVDSDYCIGFYFSGNYTEYDCNFINGNIVLNIPEFAPQPDLTLYLLKGINIQAEQSPPSPPLPPTVSIETLFLKPEILIPLIISSVIFLILFIFIFRLCTKERADSFIRVFNTITRRKSNKVVVDTSQKIKVKQVVRK